MNFNATLCEEKAKRYSNIDKFETEGMERIVERLEMHAYLHHTEFVPR